MWPHKITQSSLWHARWSEWQAVLWARHKLLLTLLLLIIACGAMAITLRQPLYESSLKILVTTEKDTLTNPQSHAAQLQSEIELLKSRPVLEAVAQKLQLSETTSTQLTENLTIAAVENSHVVNVSARSASPEQTAQFLNTLFQTYSHYRQSLRAQTTPDAALRARSADFNQKIEAASNTLQKMDALHGVTAPVTRQELLLKQLSEVQKQADAASLERREIEQRMQALRTQLATQPEQIETGSITRYAQALDKLKEELASLEMQRTQLQQKYQPNHRLLRDHEQRIAQVKALIAQEEQNPPRERSFALNETRRRLSDELLTAEAQMAALTQREQRLSTLVREYQSQLATLNLQTWKKNDIERERTLNEDAWRRFEQKAQEAEINAVLQQANSLQVRLVEPAGIHPRPINRHWSRDLVGLFLVGMVISVGGTVLVESVNPRLRNEAGLQRRLGLKVLASLPAQTKAPDNIR